MSGAQGDRTAMPAHQLPDGGEAKAQLPTSRAEALDEEPGCDVVIIARPEELPESGQREPASEAPWHKAPPAEQ